MQDNETELMLLSMRGRFIETPEYLELRDDVCGRLRGHAASVLVLGERANGVEHAVNSILKAQRHRAVIARVALQPVKASEPLVPLVEALLCGLGAPAVLMRHTREPHERLLRRLEVAAEEANVPRVLYMVTGLERAGPSALLGFDFIRDMAASRGIEVQFVHVSNAAAVRALANAQGAAEGRAVFEQQLRHCVPYRPFNLANFEQLLFTFDQMPFAPQSAAESDSSRLMDRLLGRWREQGWRLHPYHEQGRCVLDKSMPNGDGRRTATIGISLLLALVCRSIELAVALQDKPVTVSLMTHLFEEGARQCGLLKQLPTA